MKGVCPICGTGGYTQPTLLNHLLTSHGERPTLARTICDLVERLNHWIGLQDGTHDRATCILCVKEAALLRARRRVAEA